MSREINTKSKKDKREVNFARGSRRQNWDPMAYYDATSCAVTCTLYSTCCIMICLVNLVCFLCNPYIPFRLNAESREIHDLECRGQRGCCCSEEGPMDFVTACFPTKRASNRFRLQHTDCCNSVLGVASQLRAHKQTKLTREVFTCAKMEFEKKTQFDRNYIEPNVLLTSVPWLFPYAQGGLLDTSSRVLHACKWSLPGSRGNAWRSRFG